MNFPVPDIITSEPDSNKVIWKTEADVPVLVGDGVLVGVDVVVGVLVVVTVGVVVFVGVDVGVGVTGVLIVKLTYTGIPKFQDVEADCIKTAVPEATPEGGTPIPVPKTKPVPGPAETHCLKESVSPE